MTSTIDLTVTPGPVTADSGPITAGLVEELFHRVHTEGLELLGDGGLPGLQPRAPARDPHPRHAIAPKRR